MGDYSGQTATELDSHANMAVSGANVLIISKSGLVATVTPFLADLPPMDDVIIIIIIVITLPQGLSAFW